MQDQPKMAGLPMCKVGHQMLMTASIYNFADFWARGGDIVKPLASKLSIEALHGRRNWGQRTVQTVLVGTEDLQNRV